LIKFGRNIQSFLEWSLHVGLRVITLSSLKLHTKNNLCMLSGSVIFVTFSYAISDEY